MGGRAAAAPPTREAAASLLLSEKGGGLPLLPKLLGQEKEKSGVAFATPFALLNPADVCGTTEGHQRSRIFVEFATEGFA
ncbi:hypothetical protein Sjap_002744 [Stephania japonica]|uniref:Uncharacterized protein n=1 Tax=Stephania japonica TaxID=461633 RepID=A0AAP0KPR8_9MAGN